MITRKDLLQYSDTVEYLNSVKDRKEKYKIQIDKLTNRIKEIEEGEIVKDSVKGGAGGLQTYKIEGFPSKEYQERKTRLLLTRMNYEKAQSIVDEQEKLLSEKVAEIEGYISTIEDSKIKCIVSMRMQGDSWNRIADVIGKNATEDSVRMLFNRFVEKNS